MITPANQDLTAFYDAPGGDRIAYRHIRGEGPTILWFGGFLSDMTGSKIARLSEVAHERNWDFLCFDYFAHGETGGAFDDARVGRWYDNALMVAENLTTGPLVGVSSSMGGHMLALLISRGFTRIKAAGFLAPAADFATALMLPSLNPEQRRVLDVSGVHMMPGYDRPVPLSQAFFAEAAQHEVLKAPIAFDGPVRILHGMQDDLVPWQHGLGLLETFTTPNAHIRLIKDGDHRLSRRQDLDLLVDMVSELRKFE